MNARARTMGRLILLQRVREEGARAALARAAGELARAEEAERRADAAQRAAQGAAAEAERAPPAERPLAQVLEYQSRFLRSMRRAAIATELHKAKVRGERITAEEAAARLGATWERARRARERFEERERRHRREAQRAQELREEAEEADRPGWRNGGPGGPGGD